MTSDAFQTTYGGNTDAFIAILDPTKSPASTQLVYSTYFGGDGADSAFDLKEDSNGVLYVSGYTESAGLPSTSNALQADYDGSLDAFGLKLDPTKAGAAASTTLRISGTAACRSPYGVDVDSKGNMYLVGSTSTGLLGQFGGPGARNGGRNRQRVFDRIRHHSSSSSTAASPSGGSPGVIRHPHLPVSPHR